MPKCIYCKRRKPHEGFSHREHVIPQAFGTFAPKNLILNNKWGWAKYVCNNCNNNLSKLEKWLVKDSYEGYIGRSKYAGKYSSPDRRRVVIKIAEGDYQGVYVELGSGHTILLMPQIGLQKSDGDWDYFLINEIQRIDKKQYDFQKNSLRAFGLSDEEVKNVFNQIGVKFIREGTSPSPSGSDILCKKEWIVDKIIRRAIAKIAFNFFAYFNSKQIALNMTFDEIRQFILTGKNEIPMQIENGPILADEDYWNRRLGHIVTLNQNENGHLIAQISLYNYFKYTILLAENFTHDGLKTGIGRFFDISSGEIVQLHNIFLK